ncbi:hypothetical protein [Hymenobacter guriensis]|uniref:Outer membrane protein beta-barrel domain-containing protein n=1 Tax=Hymenobacter guriensis TaxID=2793065 RepID=A0ABS0L079_9BACT|nr:hypothetical protein [Hymenobacter guriensis]MBG8553519.1 hypothetical protein [Hymenobacter guriensis]
MKKSLLLSTVVGLGSCLPVAAQRVLFQGDVAADTAVQRSGPNRVRYGHGYIGYAPVVGASAVAMPLRYGASGELFLGWRQKWRLSQPLALGLNGQYCRLTYRLDQGGSKQLPTAAQYDQESLTWQQVQVEPFLRLNVGRRGNVIGRYVDVGGWGGWVFSTLHSYKDRPAAGPKVVKVTERGLPYAARWSYGVSARLGSDRYAVVARRRFSTSWQGAETTGWAEPPRWTVGLELGWF